MVQTRQTNGTRENSDKDPNKYSQLNPDKRTKMIERKRIISSIDSRISISKKINPNTDLSQKLKGIIDLKYKIYYETSRG